MGIRERLGELVHRVRTKIEGAFDLESTGRLIVYSLIVGIIGGLGAAGFFYCLEAVQELCFDQLMEYEPPDAGSEGDGLGTYHLPKRWWAVLLVPTLGGLLCGLLVYTLAPEAEGHGTDAMVRSFHRSKGVVRGRVPLVKAIASVLTIGTGGSAGREGPIAQIGAGVGSFMATRLGLSDFERRYLMLAGAAAGIGAIFRAPLGAALFVGEVLYCSTAMEFAMLVPAVMASVVAYTVFSSIYGAGFAFTTPKGADAFIFHGAEELPFYVVFALLCSVAGLIYISFFYSLRDRFFRKLAVPNVLKPAIGGLVIGIIAIWLPQIMAGGYGWVQIAIDGNWGVDSWTAVRFMLILAAAKVVATSFTISSGGSGGVFAPSLFIGAMLGGAYGLACRELFGEAYVPQPGAYVLIGMAGFFAGVAKVPLTALLMVTEMSGSYELIVPLMVVSTINVAVLSSRVTLYEEQVMSPIDSPAHLGDFVVDILARIHVREVFRTGRNVDFIPQGMPLPAIIRKVASSTNSYFPVVDDSQNLVGIFSLSDIRSVMENGGAGDLVVAADIATSPVLTVTPDDDLHKALRRFTQKNIDEIPVVDPENPRQVLGLLRRKEVIASYDEQLAAARHGHEQ